MSKYFIQRIPGISVRRQIIFTGSAVLLHILVLYYLNHSNDNSAVAPNTPTTAVTPSTVNIRLQSTSAHITESAPVTRTIPKRISTIHSDSTSPQKNKQPEADHSSLTPESIPAVSAAQSSASQYVQDPQGTSSDDQSPLTGTTNSNPESPATTAITPTPDNAADTRIQANSDIQNADTKTTDIASLSIAPPPSGIIKMKLIRTEPQHNPIYGVGEISWKVENGKYQLRIQAALDLLLTTLHLYQLDSEGTLERFGITPRISTETRRGRSATATHFDPLAGNISFSSSNKAIKMSDGAQDKASVFMQLAGIGQAAPSQFIEGRNITVQVAEDRDATVFQFKVLGQEEIDTKLGKLTTWHLIRPPRPGSYNSTLDLWLAPAYAWYPVQIRNTESNGAITTQTATHIQYTQ
ncbi:DUF3108 domain-containing protein [Undibacterium sp. SXout7W]|uniref:DUF3108 domain-containing protein n=1 Tax=Undibacterium sp. SXout7W TaxID=3413049 RepID=UPI003BF015AA